MDLMIQQLIHQHEKNKMDFSDNDTEPLKIRLLKNEYRQKMQIYEIFKSQDLEMGDFDVAFEIDGKKLFAHKIILKTASETFNVMLSNRWTKKDEVIKIKGYSYDNFYQFLCFVYSGACDLTNGNIFSWIDMAEFYALPLLKVRCDEFLYKTGILNLENIEEMLEFADKYALKKFEASIDNFIGCNFEALFKRQSFLNRTQIFVKKMAAFKPATNLEENFFEAVYKWVERQVKEKATMGEKNFNLQKAIKMELETIIPHPKFCDMSYEFLLNFVVEKGFFLSAAEFGKFFVKYRDSKQHVDEDMLFKSVYDLAEKQSLQKQKMSSDLDNFNLAGTIKTYLTEVIPCVRFYEMNKRFLIDFVVENGFILSSTDLSKFHQKCTGTESECFKQVFELVEKQALQKQKISSDPDNFSIPDCIKDDLAEIIPQVEFDKMDKQFLMNFVLEKGFTLSPSDLSNFRIMCTGTESERFKQVYELAEKQALQKQKMSPDPDNFSIDDSIKGDLAKVKFYHMDKSFLNDFVVAKGIITEEQASRVYDTHFYVECYGQRIRGTLKDNADICRAIDGTESCELRHRLVSTTKRRFLKFDLPVPSTPSTVTKMKGVEWYLCFEKSKVLTLKHHSLIQRSDYLLAEMKGDTHFELGPGEKTRLTAKCNNI